MIEQISKVKNYLLDLQNRICDFLEQEDAAGHFVEDAWTHTEGGGGLTRTFAASKIIEKAGVNFSHVRGMQLPHAATLKRPQFADATFQALGVSVVVHPHNPYVPTTHMNVRLIIVEKPDTEPHWWFGGGFDLTPYYGFEEDCVHWHQMAANACAPFGTDVYAQYKKWCDDYFYLKHRQEPRGIGGIFFDDLQCWDFEKCFAFMQSVGDHFIQAYQPILAVRKQHAYTQRERDFQAYRRGRYVEFNLLYDRGTLFGLQSGGRTESILMSLPPVVNWHYNWQPEKNSAEEKLYREFLGRKEWIEDASL